MHRLSSPVCAFLFILLVALPSLAVAQASSAQPPATLEGWADRLARFGKAIPQEKVYVHMDNTCYFLGDTLWFAAYTRRTDTGLPSDISRILYVELLNQDGYLIERQLIEMLGGHGHGNFALSDTLYAGYYELRAYTRWQLNWGITEKEHTSYAEEWFFSKELAKEFYRDYEKLYSRVFPVYDKPRQPGEFYHDMTARPLRRYFKSGLPEPQPVLSLFPEGGNLVAGVPCRVAFEAATEAGEALEGKLVIEEAGVEDIPTVNRGRGVLTFTPETGRIYEAVFTADDGRTARAKFPAAETDGVALHVDSPVRQSTDSYTLTLTATGAAASKPLGVTIMREGVVQHTEVCEASAAPVQILFDPSRGQAGGAPGVYQATVFDADGRVYADRLFFVTSPTLAHPALTVEGLKEQYAPYEEAILTIQRPAIPSPGPPPTLSLAVRDAAIQDYTYDNGSILTEMLLASELKGFIPDPAYFFEADDEEHRQALDLLMLTQGWRRFDWHVMATPKAFAPTQPAETQTQILRGDIYDYDSPERPATDHLLTLNLPGVFFLTKTTANTANLGLPKSGDEIKGEILIYSEPNPFGDTGGFYGPDLQIYPHQLFSLHSSVPNARLPEKLMPYIYDAMASIGHEEEAVVGIAVQKATELNYPSGSYRMTGEIARARYGERRGLATKNVWLHAEFAQEGSDVVLGDVDVSNGHFQVPTPHFFEKCVLFLGASDPSKWRNGRPTTWVEMDETLQPEFYVRIAWPYPRFTKPYSHYQCHLAPLRENSVERPSQTGFSLDRDLHEVTIRAHSSGLHHYDASAPVLRVDAYRAFNEAVDAGFSTSYYGGAVQMFSNMARLYVGDMDTQTPYLVEPRYDRHNTSYTHSHKALNAYNFLYNLDSVFVYTDFSPRNPDTRVTEKNVGRVTVDLRRIPDEGQRVTYRDRRYILQGFNVADDFYHPDYQRTPNPEAAKDYRRTLYWNPDLQLGPEGKATVRFFTGSRPATLTVEANGQTSDGTPMHVLSSSN